LSKWQKTAIACPCGISSDAFSIDVKGYGYCFSGNCKKNNWSPRELGVTQTIGDRESTSSMFQEEQKEVVVSYDGQGTVEYRRHRGLSDHTIRMYDIKTKIVDGVEVEVGFKYPWDETKIRSLDKKSFITKGKSQPGLFGRDKFDAGSRDSITITEGEFDAPSIYEATRGRTAAVSVHSASQAKRDCIADRDYINSFPKIIICFDNDEAGQKAAREVSSLFDFNKVYHVKLGKYKDASDYFQHGEVDNLEAAWKAAKRYSPDNIISSFEDIREALKKSQEDQIGTYPFRSLQAMTYGMHKGEIVVFKGFEKIGKTEIFRAIEHHLLKTTKANLGIIHLEEDNATTIKGIAGYELSRPAILPDSGLSEEDVFEAYRKAVGNNDSRVHLYQSFETEDEELFLDGIRFLAAGAGCQFIFFDHISWLATGNAGDDQDERKKLDRISQKLKLLAKELGICILMISHVNDEGKTRGSRNITKVANTIIHMDRDKLHPDEHVRCTTKLTLEGVRLGGSTGPAGLLYMDPMTRCLRDYEPMDDTNDNFGKDRMKVA
jgi:twinkle protein